MTSGLRAIAAEADAIAAAVRACPAVAGLYGGGLAPVVTLLPGRRVDGVHADDDSVQLAVVAAYGPPLIALVDQVRAAVAPLAGGRRIDVHVADLQLPGEEQPALSATPEVSRV